ncbi:MAG: PEGA domain-containing protein [Melioribacteraceae bacterium]
MKKIIYSLPFIIILFISCREGIVDFPDDSKTGTLFISSSPVGAEIFFESNKTGKVTPDSLIILQPGSYNLKLHLPGYPDENFSVNVQSGQRKYINISFSGY